METFDNLKKRMGKRIKFFRKKRNLTQEKLSEMINVESRHISRIETGSQAPSLKILNEICNVLGIEFEDLTTAQKNNEIQKNEIKKYMLEILKIVEKIIKIL